MNKIFVKQKIFFFGLLLNKRLSLDVMANAFHSKWHVTSSSRRIKFSKKKKKKKTAYKSPLLDPMEVGELYVFEYNLFLLTYMRTQKSLPLRLERERETNEPMKCLRILNSNCATALTTIIAILMILKNKIRYLSSSIF